MSKSVKITTSSDNTYIVALVGDTEIWAATIPGETVPAFTFMAPEDATKDTLAGEVDYLEMTSEDDEPSGFEDEDFGRVDAFSY